MSEEQKKEAEQEVGDKEEVVEPSDVELQAMDQGWVSKEEWEESGRDPNEWRPAKEFVERGELYKSLHQTKRDLKQTQAALTSLQQHHQYVFEKAHAKALDDLKREKRAAVREEEHELAEQIDEEIDRLKEEHAKEKR
jgi:hypothetical protein